MPTPPGPLSDVIASLVAPHDVAGTLSALLRASTVALHAEASCLLVGNRSGSLELLGSSSHDEDELTLHGMQTEIGPCVDAWLRNESIVAPDRAAMTSRWPVFTEAMRESGFASVLVAPFRWAGEPLGAMGLYRREGNPFNEDDITEAQMFANLAMLAVLHTDEVTTRVAAQRIDDALAGRIVIEQAKGVLAYQRRLSMSEAFDALREIANSNGHASLTEAAHRVVMEAETPR